MAKLDELLENFEAPQNPNLHREAPQDPRLRYGKSKLDKLLEDFEPPAGKQETQDNKESGGWFNTLANVLSFTNPATALARDPRGVAEHTARVMTAVEAPLGSGLQGLGAMAKGAAEKIDERNKQNNPNGDNPFVSSTPMRTVGEFLDDAGNYWLERAYSPERKQAFHEKKDYGSIGDILTSPSKLAEYASDKGGLESDIDAGIGNLLFFLTLGKAMPTVTLGGALPEGVSAALGGRLAGTTSGLLGKAGLNKAAQVVGGKGAKDLLSSSIEFAPTMGLGQSIINAGTIVNALKEQGLSDSEIADNVYGLIGEELPADVAFAALTGNVMKGNLGRLAGRNAPTWKNVLANSAGVPLEGAGGHYSNLWQAILSEKYSGQPYGEMFGDNRTEYENEASRIGAMFAALGIPSVYEGVQNARRADAYAKHSQEEADRYHDARDEAPEMARQAYRDAADERIYWGNGGKDEGKTWFKKGDNVSLNGAQPDLMNAIDSLADWLYKKTGRRLVVTSGTNGDHPSNSSEHGHSSGWKVDVVDEYNDGEDSDLITADFQKGRLADEFIAYGRSLGLGMNFEGAGTSNVHFDIALDGTQWDGYGENAGGFRGGGKQSARTEQSNTYDNDFTPRQNEIWQVAQYASDRLRNEYNIRLAPELIYKQWVLEDGGDFTHPTRNWGGLKDTSENFRSFDSDKAYADAYVDDFMRLRGEELNAVTDENGMASDEAFTQVMLDTGYITQGDYNNYVNGLPNISAPKAGRERSVQSRADEIFAQRFRDRVNPSQQQQRMPEPEPIKTRYVDIRAEDDATQKLFDQFAQDRLAKAVESKNVDEASFWSRMFNDDGTFNNTKENRDAIREHYGDDLSQFIANTFDAAETPQEQQPAQAQNTQQGKPQPKQTQQPAQSAANNKANALLRNNDVIQAGNKFLEELRSTGKQENANTAFELQAAIQQGDVAAIKDILKANGRENLIQQAQQESQTQSQPQQTQEEPVKQNTTPENVLARADTALADMKRKLNGLQQKLNDPNNTPEEKNATRFLIDRLQSRIQTLQEARDSNSDTAKITQTLEEYGYGDKSSSTQETQTQQSKAQDKQKPKNAPKTGLEKAIDKAHGKIAKGRSKTAVAKRAAIGRALAFIADHYGVEIPQAEREALREKGDANLIEKWREQLMYLGHLPPKSAKGKKSQPVQTTEQQPAQQDHTQPTQETQQQPSLIEQARAIVKDATDAAQKNWDEIKQGYKERGITKRAEQDVGNEVNDIDDMLFRDDETAEQEERQTQADLNLAEKQANELAELQTRQAEEKRNAEERQRQDAEHEKEMAQRENLPNDISNALAPASSNNVARQKQGNAIADLINSKPFQDMYGTIQLPNGLEQSLRRGDKDAIKTAQQLMQRRNVRPVEWAAPDNPAPIDDGSFDNAETQTQQTPQEQQQEPQKPRQDQREETATTYSEPDRVPQADADRILATAPVARNPREAKAQGAAILRLINSPQFKATYGNVKFSEPLVRALRDGKAKGIEQAQRLLAERGVTRQGEQQQTTQEQPKPETKSEPKAEQKPQEKTSLEESKPTEESKPQETKPETKSKAKEEPQGKEEPKQKEKSKTETEGKKNKAEKKKLADTLKKLFLERTPLDKYPAAKEFIFWRIDEYVDDADESVSRFKRWGRLYLELYTTNEQSLPRLERELTDGEKKPNPKEPPKSKEQNKQAEEEVGKPQEKQEREREEEREQKKSSEENADTREVNLAEEVPETTPAEEPKAPAKAEEQSNTQVFKRKPNDPSELKEGRAAVKNTPIGTTIKVTHKKMGAAEAERPITYAIVENAKGNRAVQVLDESGQPTGKTYSLTGENLGKFFNSSTVQEIEITYPEGAKPTETAKKPATKASEPAEQKSTQDAKPEPKAEPLTPEQKEIADKLSKKLGVDADKHPQVKALIDKIARGLESTDQQLATLARRDKYNLGICTKRMGGIDAVEAALAKTNSLEKVAEASARPATQKKTATQPKQQNISPNFFLKDITLNGKTATLGSNPVYQKISSADLIKRLTEIAQRFGGKFGYDGASGGATTEQFTFPSKEKAQLFQQEAAKLLYEIGTGKKAPRGKLEAPKEKTTAAEEAAINERSPTSDTYSPARIVDLFNRWKKFASPKIKGLKDFVAKANAALKDNSPAGQKARNEIGETLSRQLAPLELALDRAQSDPVFAEEIKPFGITVTPDGKISADSFEGLQKFVDFLTEDINVEVGEAEGRTTKVFLSTRFDALGGSEFSIEGNADTRIINLIEDDAKLTPQQKLLKDFAAQLGLQLQFFDNPDGRFHGAFVDGISFLNVNSKKGLDGVFWHESFHWLKANNPELYAKLVDAAGITQAQRDAFLERTGRNDLATNEEIDEEILADQMDDVAKRTGLLQSLAGKNRGVVERVVQWLKDTMNKFIDMFRNPQGRLTTAQAKALADQFAKIARDIKDADGKPIFRVNNRTGDIEVIGGRTAPQTSTAKATAAAQSPAAKYSIAPADNSNEAWKKRLKRWVSGLTGSKKQSPDRIHQEMKQRLMDLSNMKIAAGHLPKGVQEQIDEVAKVIRTKKEYDWVKILPHVGNAVANQLGITQSTEMSNCIAKYLHDGVVDEQSAEGKEFIQAMRNNEEMRDKIIATQEVFGRWREMDDVQKQIASIQFGESTENLTLKERGVKFWRELRRQLFDAQAPIGYQVEHFEKATGMKLADSLNPEVAFRNLRGTQGIALSMIDGGRTEVKVLQGYFAGVNFDNFQTVAETLHKAGVFESDQNYKEFANFVTIKQILTLHKHNDNNRATQAEIRQKIAQLKEDLELAGTKKERTRIEQAIERRERALSDLQDSIKELPEAWDTKEKCEKGLAKLTAKHGDKFEKAQKALVEYTKVLMAMRVDAGLMSVRRFNELLNAFPDYVPLHRIFDENSDLEGDSDKHMVGSGKDIIDPIQAIMDNTFDIVHRCEKNKAKQMLATLARFDGVGRIFEEVEPGSNDGTIINFYEGGKRKCLQCADPALVKAVNNLAPAPMNWAMKLFRVPTLVLKGATTAWSPAFMARNMFRDPQDAYVYSAKNGGNVFKDALKYMTPLFALKCTFDTLCGNSKTYEALINKLNMEVDKELLAEYRIYGGSQSTFFDFDADVKADLFAKYTKGKWKRFASPKGVIQLLEKLGELSERGTRLQRFKQVKDNLKAQHGGINIYDDLVTAAFESRDLMDFARHGEAGHTWNTMAAFANPALQGMDKLIRTFDVKKLKMFGGTEETQKQWMSSLARLAIGSILPAIVLAMLHKDEDWYKDDLQPWEKDAYWILGENLKIPKGADVATRFFSNLAEALVNSDNEPIKAKRILMPLYDGLPNLLPTAMAPVIECFFNKDLFKGTPIIPMRERYLSATPEKQYDSSNSNFAIWLGNKLGVSPRYVDHIIYGYTGNLGKGGMKVVDTGLHATGLSDKPVQPWTQAWIPVVGGFLREPYANSKIVKDYYTELDQQRSYVEAYKLDKKNRKKDAKLDENFDRGWYARLTGAEKAMGEFAKRERAILDNPNLTSEQVEEQRLKIQEKRIALLRRIFKYKRAQ